MKDFLEWLENRCWKGYKPVPGKKPYSKKSCRKIKEGSFAESEIDNSISIGEFEGTPDEEFQAVNLIQGGRQIGRINFGMHKLDKGFDRENGGILYDYYGTIDDVYLLVRGTNAMRFIYPKIEQRLKNAGAKRIKLNTTDDAVGLKVWKPLGFNLVGQYGTGGAKIWEKNL